MHRVLAILLASTCMVYSRKINQYPLSIPIEYIPQEYEYEYQDRPYIDKTVYLNSITRTDENFQPDNNVLETTTVYKNVPLSSPSPNPHESEEPELTSSSSLILPSKEVQKNKYPKTDNSLDTSFDERPKSPSSNASLLNTYQEQPEYQDYNDYPSNNWSPHSKSYQERPKYSNYIKFPSNNPTSKTYQKRLKSSKENKYPYHISIPLKSYQERPKYEKTDKFPAKNVYPYQTTYQERLKYENFHEFPLNNDLPSQKVHKERPENPKTYKNPDDVLPSESSSEEQSKYPSYNESPPSKPYQELPKYLPNKKVSSTSKTYEDSDDDEYHDISPPLPEHLAPQYPDKDYTGSWHAPSFYQSLKDFDEAENIVQSQIFGKGSKQNEKQYTIIAGVIDGMISTMAHTPWRFYDQVYDEKIPKLFKYARVTRHLVNAQVKCIFEWINQGIQKLRAIINNRLINHICSVSEVPCDTLVLAVVDTSNHVDLQKEARLLLALGKTAGLFLNRYAKTLDRQASTNRPSNLYAFLLGSKIYLKPLIKAGSEVRNLLPSSFSCYDAPINQTSGEERPNKW